MRKTASMMAIASCAVAASAQASYMAARACKAPDLQGLWENVSIKEEPEGAVTSALKAAPYEYILFDGLGKFAYEARAIEADVSDENKLAAFMQEIVTASAKSGKFNDKLTNTGHITLSHNNQPWAEYKCVIAQEDSEESGVKTGDMVWYTLEGVSPYLKRVERRISRPIAL